MGFQVQDRFRNAYQEVKTTMAQLYSFFQNDSEEVQHEWLKFTQKVCPAVFLEDIHCSMATWHECCIQFAAIVAFASPDQMALQDVAQCGYCEHTSLLPACKVVFCLFKTLQAHFLPKPPPLHLSCNHLRFLSSCT